MFDFLADYELDFLRFAYPPKILEPTLENLIGKVDIVVGGLSTAERTPT